jgi:hypothetical protein
MSLADEPMFFKALDEGLQHLPMERYDPETKSSKDWIRPKDWTRIVAAIDGRIQSCIAKLQAEAPEEQNLAQLRLKLLLDFAELFFLSTKEQTHPTFVSSVARLLESDHWPHICQALRIMKAHTFRKKPKQKKCAMYEAKDTMQWLQNIALGLNLKLNRKVPLQDVLRTSGFSCSFQYCCPAPRDAPSPASPDPSNPLALAATASSNKQLEGPPLIRTISLDQLSVEKGDSCSTARRIAATATLPPELFPAFWCKVRLAKTVTSEETKYQAVLASLLATYIFCKGSHLSSQ